VNVTPSLPANLSGYKGDTKLLAASASGPVLEKKEKQDGCRALSAAAAAACLLLDGLINRSWGKYDRKNVISYAPLCQK
jgi:hypothetical protein